MYALSFVGPTYSNTYRVMLKLCTYPEIFCYTGTEGKSSATQFVCQTRLKGRHDTVNSSEKEVSMGH